MKPPIVVREPSKKEREALEAGLHSSDAFVLRRCQILLASSKGGRPPRIAENLGCAPQTVRNAIPEFNRHGFGALRAGSSRPREVHAAFDEDGAEALREMLHHSPREFGKQASIWTLADAAEASFEEDLTQRRVSAETIRATLARLGVRQAVDREPRSRVREEKGALKRLIRLAESNPEWVLGYEDETWWSRFEQPSLHSWAEAGEPMHLLQKEAKKDDPDPEAPSCYGLYLPELGHSTWLRFVDGRPVNAISTQFLSWSCQKLEEVGKKALVLVWDTASWHKPKFVKKWIAAHNREIRERGSGVRIVPCILPKKSPWLNAIEPKWVHGKRKVVEPDLVLTAYELADRVCGVFGCIHEPHLSIPQEVA